MINTCNQINQLSKHSVISLRSSLQFYLNWQWFEKSWSADIPAVETGRPGLKLFLRPAGIEVIFTAKLFLRPNCRHTCCGTGRPIEVIFTAGRDWSYFYSQVIFTANCNVWNWTKLTKLILTSWLKNYSRRSSPGRSYIRISLFPGFGTKQEVYNRFETWSKLEVYFLGDGKNKSAVKIKRP